MSPWLISIFAAATPRSPQPEELQRLHYALILTITIGIIGVLLIVAMLAAWRNFHKRIAELEAERDHRRQQDPHADAWQESGERVQLEPSPRRQDTGEDAEEDGDSDLYGKDWEPGDDDDDPDERSW